MMRAVDKVLAVCANQRRPPWLLSARIGTVRQSRTGVDIVVRVIGGELLYLQTRTSEAGGREWRRRRAQAERRGPVDPVGLVVVLPSDTPAALLLKVVAALEPLRRTSPSWQVAPMSPPALRAAASDLRTAGEGFLAPMLDSLADRVEDGEQDVDRLKNGLERLAAFSARTQGPAAPLTVVLVNVTGMLD